ncbi:hypothetical protein HDU87_007477 [Geranomyces variabilis]|uniref:Coiled-coil domain-containing protein n=1 Tax=Geranomyces variabilis TaxID=109894 RepID=A0AAD5TRL6_9FUNG|nr:hypothetical protein HDU87_007477 [Geranomyces variabilis]
MAFDPNHGDGYDSSADSDVSLLEALSGSERVSKGNITFDWSALPTTILTAVPDPPPSAKKQLQGRRSARARQEKENLDTRHFVAEKLAEWAGRSLTVDGTHGGSRGPLLDRSLGSHAASVNIERSRAQLDLEKLYTFNNCKFTYRGRTPTPPPDLNDSLQTKGAAAPAVATSIVDVPAAETSGNVRFAADTTADTSCLAATNESARLDIRQLLDIVQELQREENPESGDCEASVMDASHASETKDDMQATLINIHQDLSALAKRVKVKSKTLKLREQEVSERETRLAAEIEAAVQARQDPERQRELAKENRRLQTSVRDLVASNKQARDQIRKLQDDAQANASQLKSLQTQLRTARERRTQMKAAADAEAQKVKIQAVQAESRKEPASSHKIWKPTRSVMSQTSSQRESTGTLRNDSMQDKLQAAAFYAAISSLMRSMVELRQGSNRRQPDPNISFRDLVMLFPQAEMDVASDCAHLQFMLHALKTFGLDVAERYTIAQMAYVRLNSNQEHTAAAELRILLLLIVLSGVTQPDVVSALLDTLTGELTTPAGKSLFLKHRGVDVVHQYLRFKGAHIPFAASATLLLFCAEGEWLRDFVGQCSSSDVVDSLAMVLTSNLSAAVMENVAVIVQKMSRVMAVQGALRAHPTLLPRLRELLGTTQSEFLAFNVRSSLNNLNSLS